MIFTFDKKAFYPSRFRGTEYPHNKKPPNVPREQATLVPVLLLSCTSHSARYTSPILPIRSWSSPALRLQVDSIHLHTNGETDFYQGLLKAGDLIGQVDISDVDRMAPDGRHFDFPLLIQALKETGFQDYLVFEFRANPPADAAKAGLDYIRALL